MARSGSEQTSFSPQVEALAQPKDGPSWARTGLALVARRTKPTSARKGGRDMQHTSRWRLLAKVPQGQHAEIPPLTGSDVQSQPGPGITSSAYLISLITSGILPIFRVPAGIGPLRDGVASMGATHRHRSKRFFWLPMWHLPRLGTRHPYSRTRRARPAIRVDLQSGRGQDNPP